MKIKMLKVVLLFALSMLISPFVFAQESQDTATIWTITTTDGNEYIGIITAEDTKVIQLKTENLGVITISKSLVLHREKVEKENIVEGEFWFENPQSTRYFWGPNGYGLKKGEGYYQNIWIAFNQVSYGFTDHFTLGLGTVPLFLFGSGIGEYSPIWLTPKLSFPLVKDKVNIGVGALMGGVFGGGSSGDYDDDDSFFGSIVYGSFTYGSRDRNASLNLGYGYVDGEWSSSPTISASFMGRVSRRTYLLSENYFISAGGDNVGILSFGARTVWDKISLDYGLLVFVSDFTGTWPWVGFSIPMGKLRRGG